MKITITLIEKGVLLVAYLLALAACEEQQPAATQQSVADTPRIRAPSQPADISAYAAVTDDRLLNPEPENWLMFRRTYDGQGYSPLEQINVGNVSNLEAVWSISTGLTEGHQSPPIVNDGIMFITTPLNHVIALDADSGDGLWEYARQMPFDISLIHPTNRGVAPYGDKVYMATSDANVVALDARSGEVIWEQPVADYRNGYYMTLAPLPVEGKILVGVSGGERGIRGFITALDAESGEELWKTYTIPGPGEFGNDTWPEDGWQTGGASVWVTGNYDPELNMSFWGIGNAGPWAGDARPGDNLYANAVIALDMDTGELQGYHQYHWNGSWDWDEVSTPILMDVEREGRTFKALVHPGRNGYLWVLERTAEGINFIDAEPYVYQDVFTSIDPETGRPTYDMAHKPGLGKVASYCPSLSGGKNWVPAAYSPQTGLLYIPANDNYCSSWEGTDVEYRPGQGFTGTTNSSASIIEGADHIGEIQAWNVNTGEEVWTKEFELANWGPILATAGNLIFSGGTADRFFRAHNASTGELVWEQRLNSGITGVPTSFAVNGKQYIAVQSGWGIDAAGMQRRLDSLQGRTTIVPQGGVLWVFALDD
ncbi:MAG: PQQ-dependent dehydrogenase, methanol/ethanol family [Gammaproteobacteria bacterium]|nr:PQQ-dependent dehydrogenase, methanol/ethanol family [Gammaproteobacteria bacterium]